MVRGSLPPFAQAGPRDADLTGVVRELTPVIRRGRPPGRDPNETDVRWLLEAGVLALARRLLDHEDNQDAWGFGDANDILGSVTLAEVMGAFRDLARDCGVDPGAANKDRVFNRWRTTLLYQRDLLRYVFRTAAVLHRMDVIEQNLPAMLALPLGDLVDQVARAETDQVQSEPIFRLQLALISAFPNEPQIRELATVIYREQEQRWAELYRQIAQHYGVRLLDDSPQGYRDLATMFSLVVEGAHIRRAVDETLGQMSDGEHAATRTVHLLISQVTGRLWSELAVLRAIG